MKHTTQKALDNFVSAVYSASAHGELTDITEELTQVMTGGELCTHYDDDMNPISDTGAVFDALLDFMHLVDIETTRHTKPSVPEFTPIDVLLEDVANIAGLVDENHFLKIYNTFLEHQLERVRDNG
ncbi:MAG: hypothetical protein IJ121_02910 [Eubacterium sp.]|nr:hypothetical protein [Eubacterium sp.]